MYSVAVAGSLKVCCVEIYIL